MYIETTGIITTGTCDIKKKNCKANPKGIVTKVISPNEGNKNILVCNVCLNTLLRDRIWNIRGASIPEMKKLIDLAIVDDYGNILIAFELKNWKEKGIEKGEPWVKRMKEMTRERMKDLKTNLLIISTFEGLYIFIKESEDLIYINLEKEINDQIEEKGLTENDVFISDKNEFTKKPELVDLKHSRFIEIIEFLISNENTLKKFPLNVKEILISNTLILNHTL